MIAIRPETAGDAPARERLLDQVFGETRLRKTSERFREGRSPADGLAFSAVAADQLVGTVRLWNASAGPGRPALLLGPLAVDAGARGSGLGARLMTTAIDAARALGHGAILLVGDAPYYVRFGFDARLTQALWLPGPYERARFLALELRAGALSGARGLVSPTGKLAPRPDLGALVAAARREVEAGDRLAA